jgi:hypothetical protein
MAPNISLQNLIKSASTKTEDYAEKLKNQKEKMIKGPTKEELDKEKYL